MHTVKTPAWGTCAPQAHIPTNSLIHPFNKHEHKSDPQLSEHSFSLFTLGHSILHQNQRQDRSTRAQWFTTGKQPQHRQASYSAAGSVNGVPVWAGRTASGTAVSDQKARLKGQRRFCGVAVCELFLQGGQVTFLEWSASTRTAIEGAGIGGGARKRAEHSLPGKALILARHGRYQSRWQKVCSLRFCPHSYKN
jgi:hypothetical protein